MDGEKSWRRSLSYPVGGGFRAEEEATASPLLQSWEIGFGGELREIKICS